MYQNVICMITQISTQLFVSRHELRCIQLVNKLRPLFQQQLYSPDKKTSSELIFKGGWGNHVSYPTIFFSGGSCLRSWVLFLLRKVIYWKIFAAHVLNYYLSNKIIISRKVVSYLMAMFFLIHIQLLGWRRSYFGRLKWVHIVYGGLASVLRDWFRTEALSLGICIMVSISASLSYIHSQSLPSFSDVWSISFLQRAALPVICLVPVAGQMVEKIMDKDHKNSGQWP